MKRFSVQWVLPAGVAFVALAAGAADAAIPSHSGVYTACLLRAGGAVRVIDPSIGAHCTRSEQRMSWNAKGQPGRIGPTGPAGQAGAAGVAGPPGPAGISGYQIVSSPGSYTAFSNNVTKEFADAVQCPSGKVALGGGGGGSLAIGNAAAGPVELAASTPSPDGSGWQTGYAKLDGSYFATNEHVTATSYVICANVTK